LVLAVFLVFGQTLRHDFVTFDDVPYVVSNPVVLHGLTGNGVIWAFTEHHYCHNWHPLTWLSHMLDCQLYGLRPAGHHLSNVLLHTAAAVLLFLVLLRMTGDLWPSAFVAAVFAIHPLRAESVAWAAERKDVLSGLFFMLTLGAYERYVRQPFSLVRYALVAVLFALGLMAKPMLVTLPLLLLVLDYWPLRRWPAAAGNRWRVWGRLLPEKIPLLLLSAGSCAMTLVAQKEVVAGAQKDIPWPWQLANAVVSYVEYIGQLFYPLGLALHYPHLGSSLPVWKIAAAATVLAAILLAVILARRRAPYLLVGWLWYLGTLVPVIGLVQVGNQAMADRYTYLPLIGLTIGIAWGVQAATRSWPARRWACAAAATVVLAGLMGRAHDQTSYWKDGKTIWGRSLSCAPRDELALNNLGIILLKRGDLEAAGDCFRKALEISDRFERPHYNLGAVYYRQGKLAEAVAQYRTIIQINPRNFAAHNELANVLQKQGKFDEAILHYRKALQLSPESVGIRCNLGDALYAKGMSKEALAEWREAMRLQPRELLLLNRVACVLASDPDSSLRRGGEAVQLAERAVELSRPLAEKVHDLPAAQQPEVFDTLAALHDTLAAAYAEIGRFSDAIQAAQQALSLESAANRKDVADAIRARLQLYQANSPCHQRQILR
jgi:tetratricopeptide (TPR) repeat protein